MLILLCLTLLSWACNDSDCDNLPTYNPSTWDGFVMRSPHINRTALFVDATTADTARLRYTEGAPITQTVRKTRPGRTCAYQIGEYTKYTLTGTGFQVGVDEYYGTSDTGRGMISLNVAPADIIPCFQPGFSAASNGTVVMNNGGTYAATCTHNGAQAGPCYTMSYQHDPETGCDTLGIVNQLQYVGTNGLVAFSFRNTNGQTAAYRFVGYE